MRYDSATKSTELLKYHQYVKCKAMEIFYHFRVRPSHVGISIRQTFLAHSCCALEIEEVTDFSEFDEILEHAKYVGLIHVDETESPRVSTDQAFYCKSMQRLLYFFSKKHVLSCYSL